MATGWGVGAWSDGTWGGSQDALAGTVASGFVSAPGVSVTVSLTGVSAQPTVGALSLNLQVSEVHADGLTGTVKSAVTVGLSGTSANGAVGNTVFLLTATGVAATGSVGVLTATTVSEQVLSGVSSNAAVQSVLVGDRLVAITGCLAMGNVGTFGYAYWSVINDAQTPDWTNIANSGSPNWTDLTTTQNPDWTTATTAESPSWTTDNTTQSTNWTDTVTA
jgi:hypothetical protein